MADFLNLKFEQLGEFLPKVENILTTVVGQEPRMLLIYFEVKILVGLNFKVISSVDNQNDNYIKMHFWG